MSAAGVGLTSSDAGYKRSGGNNSKNRLISVNPLTTMEHGEMDDPDTKIAGNNAIANAA